MRRTVTLLLHDWTKRSMEHAIEAFDERLSSDETSPAGRFII
jgi:hypothetical protein